MELNISSNQTNGALCPNDIQQSLYDANKKLAYHMAHCPTCRFGALCHEGKALAEQALVFYYQMHPEEKL